MAPGNEEDSNSLLTLLAVGSGRLSNRHGRLQGSDRAGVCIVCVLPKKERG